jgi:predicted permease
MLLKILEVVFPVFAIVMVGFVYGRRYRPDMTVVNRLNLDVFTPALLFSVLSGRGFDLAANYWLAGAALLVVLVPGLFALWPGRHLGYSVKTLAPPLMFNNSGNMGLPLALLAFGKPGLVAGVVLFMVENFLHFSVGIAIMEHRLHPRVFLKPLFLAAAAGIVVNLNVVGVPEAVALPIRMLGDISIPLMLFALGVRLTETDLGLWRDGLVGAVVRPLLAVLVALACIGLLPLTPLQQQALVLFAALPPAVLNFLLAERYRQEPQRVAAMVLMGNAASLIVIPVTLYWLI